ncbi:hypothetical protein [Paenibacillus lentus]|uniref:Uncharacterized protein n=1 Tax=Paenibacillus lentus TaxID=1338368 RepID=A0A3Q8S5R6_9BACL|nr:hypothetical protein [Paenibacillus lentus]AZK47767.1 hypothetical protein EIM92_17695 [Paenibacillus lentus]
MSLGEPWFYIVILGVASILYAFFLPGRTTSSSAISEAASDMEVILEQYMAEIEKENAELVDLVSGMKQDLASKQMSQQESISELRQRLLEVEQLNRQLESRLGTLETSAASSSPSSTAISSTLNFGESPSQMTISHLPDTGSSSADLGAIEAFEVSENPDQATLLEQEEPEATNSLRSRYPELFDLYARGKSIDMIAKTVGIQRGEVQLILQLANREDA